MNKAQLEYACKTYGDPSLSDDEKWKSIAYISTITTKTPTFSVQYYLRTNQIQYSEKFGEPGFFLIDYLYSPYGPFANKQGLIVTFFPLDKITAISITSKNSFKDGKPTVEPEKPDVIVGVLDANPVVDKVITISTDEDIDDNGANPDAEYNIIYNGLGANTEDDFNLDIEEPELAVGASSADGESDYIFTLDDEGANPTIEYDTYDGNNA